MKNKTWFLVLAYILIIITLGIVDPIIRNWSSSHQDWQDYTIWLSHTLISSVLFTGALSIPLFYMNLGLKISPDDLVDIDSFGKKEEELD